MARHEHIRWSRVPRKEPRNTRPFFPQRPYRPSAPTHGAAISKQAEAAIERVQEEREALGIDPSKLVVMRLTFLGSNERDHLERLGARIVSERDCRESVESRYEVAVEFNSPNHLDSFLARQAPGLGPDVEVDRERASSGEASPKRLRFAFPSQEAAKEFHENSDQHAKFGCKPKTKPQHRATRDLHELVVQFPTGDTLESFTSELSAYSRAQVDADALTEHQRRALFDSLEGLSNLTPEQRKGIQLRERGSEIEDEYLDVDLWHPGSSMLVAEAIRDFERVVENHGGEVTDLPTGVAETLLLGRVRGGSALLAALLAYDLVARVDLPPAPQAIRFSALDPIDTPEELPPLLPDGPIACVVDSGVVPGHPLLRGVIEEAIDCDSGENTPIDMVGHGTHVAGIVTYGDLRRVAHDGAWVPKVRIVSAKVLQRVEWYPGAHPETGFPHNGRRAEIQFRDAIETVVQDHPNCRIFNLSLGNRDLVLQDRQLPWACTLDQLARDHDIVLVVSAGNSSIEIPEAHTEPQLQAEVREALFREEHSIIDPGTAALALTVGAVARNAVPFARDEDQRPPAVGAPVECPAPMTRSGFLDSNGIGARRLVKPELVAYGGNMCLGLIGGRWAHNDRVLDEPSLNYAYQGNRLLSGAHGTSVAAPYVTHVCALIEHRLRLTGSRPSANLIRALAVHGAEVPDAAENWLAEGASTAEGERRQLRLLGYGKPNPERSMYSDDHRVTLIAEEEIEVDHFHLYEVEIPQEFRETKGYRQVRVTLAYDPPVRGTNRNYLSRTMWFQLFRGLDEETIVRAMAKRPRGSKSPDLKSRAVKQIRPTMTSLQWSTVQSGLFRSNRKKTLEYAAEDSEPTWHVLVGCQQRFPMEPNTQRYALALSLEHDDPSVKVYVKVRERVRARARARVRR